MTAKPTTNSIPPTVSVVIVNWNTRQLLQNCLTSLYRHCDAPLIETIVVDNASSDDSVQMVNALFPQVRLLKNSENLGFAHANNQGIEYARGQFILLLNSDTIVLDNFIAALVDFARNHQDAAVFGPTVLNHDRTIQPNTFMFPSIANMAISAFYLNKIFPLSPFFAREQMTYWNRSEPRGVDVISGCCMLVRRSAIEQAGLLDDSFFMYAEETDWCYRFKKLGWKIYFAPVGSVIHLKGQSSKVVKARMLIQLRLSILKFIAKHNSRPTYILACLLTAMFFALRLPVWLLVTLFGGPYRQQAMVRLQAYATGTARVLAAAIQNPAGRNAL